MSALVSIHVACKDVRWNPRLASVSIAQKELSAGQSISKAFNYVATSLLASTEASPYPNATTGTLKSALSGAVKTITDAGGGQLFVTFTGHTLRGNPFMLKKAMNPCPGTQFALEEFLVLDDDVFCDNWLANTWARLPKGSKVLFVADCCHGAGAGWAPKLRHWLRRLADRLQVFQAVKTPSYSCPSLIESDPAKIGASVVVLSFASEDGTTWGGLVSLMNSVLTAATKPATYDELVTSIEAASKNRVYSCRFGSDPDSMWKSAPLT